MVNVDRDREQVLVVDDDEATATMVGELLGCVGFKTEVFDQSVLAAEVLHNHKPRFNILVTDLRMPEKDGLELIREATSSDPEIGVVLMTATPEDLDEKIEGFRKNGTHIQLLKKPFDINNLLGMVNKVRQPLPR